ncbi:acetoacetyl-CoA reductase [Pelistega indica]|uniref:Acetoacetyl-CoA reductase n=1 Tax=Pelistega indica TaxID=1414851 RepID=V8G8F8_9BURK|nr:MULTISPECIES: acetoacetyl-CoA reductase [Pelistega]ETD72700.1 acetoacetyl-CoA reductase [Pelistega indica]
MTTHTALITGGTGGLGTAFARALHDSGYTVLVTHLPQENPQAWLAQQAAEGYTFKAYPVDVSDFDSAQALAQTVQADGYVVDVLVNNAGITRDASFKKMTKQAWDEVMGVNLDSMFNMTKAFIEGMLAKKWGRIINIASISGIAGNFGQANYASTKAGITGFTKTLALEFASKGITVNSISPGFFRTNMTAAIPADVMNNVLLPKIPVGRLGEPEELAGLVAFMASEKAGFLTGANVNMNGGQYML